MQDDSRHSEPHKLLFVCMGNICRSPAAQAVMQRLVDDRGLRDYFEIDSAGTIDYHEGELPDRRMLRVLEANGYRCDHRSRPVHPGCDFDRFDMIVAMDAGNANWLLSRMTTDECRRKVVMMGDYLRHDHRGHRYTVVPDPYYGGPDDFTLALELIEDACSMLLEQITPKIYK